MADFFKNISNTVRAFAEGPSTKWGQANGYPYTMTWGTSTWGEGESLPIAFVKVIQNSQSMAWDYSRAQVRMLLNIGTLVASHDMTSQALMQGPWNYVFTSDTLSGEDRDFADWSVVANGDATFTCAAANGTSWSEL